MKNPLMNNNIFHRMLGILFSIIVLITPTLSQISHVELLNTLGERTYDEMGFAIATDTSGNAYVTGQFVAKFAIGKFKFANKGGTFGNKDIFVAKYNQFGAPVWAKSITGTSDEYTRSIASDAEGNTYVTGWYQSPTLSFGKSSPITISNSGAVDLFLIKFGPTGDIEWAKSNGGSVADSATAVVVDHAGNIYITGTYRSNSITFGATTLTNHSIADTLADDGSKHGDIFLVKYDTDGNVLWATSIGDTSYEIGHCLSVDNDDNVFLGGSFGSTSIILGGDTLRHSGGHHPSGYPYSDIFIAKISPSGTPIWARTAASLDADVPQGIGNDAAGNCYVAGYYNDDTLRLPNNTKFPSAGYKDIFLAKYDANGMFQWARRAGGEYSEEAKGLTVTPAGNCYITGFYESSILGFAGYDTLINGSTPSPKQFIVKYDSTGTIKWLRTSTTVTGVEIPYGIASNATGTIYTTGGYNTKVMTLDDQTIINSNQTFTFQDAFIIKIFEPHVTPDFLFTTFNQADYDISPAKKNLPHTVGNARDTAFARAFKAIKQKLNPLYPGGMPLGVPRLDSQKAYGWVRLSLKGKTVQDFLLQTSTSRGFDIIPGSKPKPFVKELKNPKDTKYNNRLAGELCVLKMNLAMSAQHVTPEGLGDLIFNNSSDPGNRLNNMTLTQIAAYVDTALTYYKRYYSSSPTPMYDSMAVTLDSINNAFEGEFSVVSNSPIRVAGVRALSEVSFLEGPPNLESFAIQGRGIEISTSQQKPVTFSLNQNYPNPFNPTTVIRYEINVPSMVTLKVYDILGKEVATILNETQMDEGAYEIPFDGSSLASGIYYYKLTGTAIESNMRFGDLKKMMLIK